MRTTFGLIVMLSACSGAPSRLSATGLYADLQSHTLAPGVVAFAPRYVLWSDGAKKQRWVFVPEGKTIDVSAPDQWVFPVGTKLWKQFERDGQVLETRYLEKTAAGWRFETYVWDSDGREANATAFFGAPNVRGTAHDVPGQGDCRFCHGGAEAPLGFTAVQLAARPDAMSPLDLAAMTSRGWLSQPLVDAELAPLSQDLAADRALGALSANCGGCHDDDGSQDDKPLRLRLRTSDRTRGDTGFFQTALGRDASRTIDGLRTYAVAGQPESSLLLHRLESRGTAAQMPPIGTELRNDELVRAVRSFIESLRDE